MRSCFTCFKTVKSWQQISDPSYQPDLEMAKVMISFICFDASGLIFFNSRLDEDTLILSWSMQCIVHALPDD